MAQASAPTFESLSRDIRSGRLAPVYILHGEEGFYIDRLTKMFEDTVPESERDFNLFTFYAPETDPLRIISACRSFPMMGGKQMVIVKEAQAARADAINKLHSYVASPSDTSVLVICFRGDKAKGKDLLPAAKKSGAVVFESKKTNERQLPTAILNLAKEVGLNIEAKGIAMLADFVGTDLARLHGEISKLAMVLGKGAMVTPEAIERNIGVSKDYNNFELVNAIAARDYGKMMRIAAYFKANPKSNPTVLTAAAVFKFFSELLVCHFTPDKSPSSLMNALGLKWQVQLRNYEIGMRSYNARRTIQIIGELRRFDCMTKGVGSRRNEYDLFHELLYQIITAKGI